MMTLGPSNRPAGHDRDLVQLADEHPPKPVGLPSGHLGGVGDAQGILSRSSATPLQMLCSSGMPAAQAAAKHRPQPDGTSPHVCTCRAGQDRGLKREAPRRAWSVSVS